MLISLAIGISVFLILFFVEREGGLQRGELAIYDNLISRRHQWLARTGHRSAKPDPRIVIVGYDEQDLRTYGHPIPDVLLADFLGKLRAMQPSAIGFDIYRDLPELCRYP